MLPFDHIITTTCPTCGAGCAAERNIKNSYRTEEYRSFHCGYTEVWDLNKPVRVTDQCSQPIIDLKAALCDLIDKSNASDKVKEALKAQYQAGG